MKPSLADLRVEGRYGDSIYLLRPTSPAGQEWIDENIAADAQMLGNAVAVEHRYITDIVCGAVADGLVVK